MMPVSSLFKHIRNAALEGMGAFLPPLCVSCEELVGESHGFCATCWRGLAFIAAPYCACCGLPFEYEGQSINEDALCGNCLIEKPKFAHARSALVYNDASKAMLLPFKHGDRTDFSRALARLMLQAGSSLFESADALLPVPLHFSRLFSRRYNQSALLVQHLSKATGKPKLLHALVRCRATPSQGTLSRDQRLQNVRNAFAVRPKAIADIQGKHLLLVDDVYTTGATANACVAALLKAGAARVDVLTLARVVKVQG